MLRLLKWCCVAALLSIFSAVAWFFIYANLSITLPSATMEFSVTPGSTLRQAARQISEAGVPMAERQFVLLARIAGKGRDIRAGSYELADGTTPWELLRKITSGDVLLVEVKFIEGWTFAQMRAALDAMSDVRHDSNGLRDADIMARIGAPEGQAPEGQFFPDTYLIAKGESDLKILGRAYRLMQKHLQAAWEQRADDNRLKSPLEALTLASIVEKETGDPSERPLISGVFHNRLRIGMRLQTDPTVIYGMGASYKGNIRKADLETDTSFNTYTRAGLPPHPIAMPGKAALLAAVRPAKTDALYFVARGDGSHQFSRGLDEHNRAVAKYQLRGR
jgi:UPF0755 protein